MAEIPIMVMPWHRPDPCKPPKMQVTAAYKSSYLDYLSSLSLEAPCNEVILTGIMCTIGPASNKTDMLIDLMDQGMTIALVPLALGVHKDHVDTIANIRAANTAFSLMKRRVYPLGIAVQTKGPGLRIGGLYKDLPITLSNHQKVTLSTDNAFRNRGTEHYLYIGFPEMCEVLSEGDLLLVGNGVVLLQVELVVEKEVVCKVVASGTISSYMTVAVPDVPLCLPPLTEQDVDDLRNAALIGVDIVVASHTQNVDHIRKVRKILEGEENGSGIKVWAQIESKQGLDNLEQIMEEADAILLSRVNLIQDIAAEKLFLAQKIVLGSCNKAGVPVFVSSHFFPSMQVDVTPSIAEMIDVSSAILDGLDGLVLRNTTSIGKHPEQTVKALTAMCREAEAAVWHHQTFSVLNSNAPPPIDPTHAIAISAVEASIKSSASAIFLATTSGRSAQLVARYRPRCPIVAVTRYGQVARQLNAWRAVIPLHYVDPPLPDWTREVDVRLQFGIEFGKERGFVKPGDTMILLNGWRQGAGFTNTIRVVYASDSFPWVYTHQLPKVIPSDKDINETEEKLSAKPTVETMGNDKSRTPKVPSTTTPIPSNSKGSISLEGLSQISHLGMKTLEEDFKSIQTAKGKELDNYSLAEEVAKVKSEMSKGVMGTKETSLSDIVHSVKDVPASEKSVSRKSQDIDAIELAKSEVVGVSNLEKKEGESTIKDN